MTAMDFRLTVAFLYSIRINYDKIIIHPITFDDFIET